MRLWHYGEEFAVDVEELIQKSIVNDLLDEICLLYETHSENGTLMVIYDEDKKLCAMLVNELGEHEDLELIFNSATEKDRMISYFESLKVT